MTEYPKTITLSRSTGESMDFVIRRCEEKDLDAILALQLVVFEQLCDQSVYALVGEKEIHESLLEDYCFGTYHDDELVAFTMMIANRISHRNYGTYVGYPEERQAKCVSMEITLVDDRYRGFGQDHREVDGIERCNDVPHPALGEQRRDLDDGEIEPDRPDL